MNEIAQQFLEAYARGGEAEGGWQFGKALQQSRLDFSAGSLGRIDHLLATIRQRAKPVREAFVADARSRNFCALLAFYLMALVARRTGARIEWHELASAQRALPDGVRLPEGSFSRIVALAPDQGAAFLPLAWIEHALFGDTPAPTCEAYVGEVVSQLERDGPPAWWTAVHAMGVLASYAMWMVLDGASLVPTLLQRRLDGEQTFTTLMSDTGEAALARGDAALAAGGEGLVCQALACEARANLPEGASDAIVVEARTYGSHPLQLSIAFPFRPAAEGRGFQIEQPTFVGGNVSAAQVGRFGAALQSGIESFKWPEGRSWSQHVAGAAAGSAASPAAPPPASPEPTARAASPAPSAPPAAPTSQAALMHEQARRHWEGTGVPRDPAKALRLWQSAAEAGHGPALLWLGLAHEQGAGVERSLDKAVGFYTRAMKAGEPIGAAHLGRLYRGGWGVPADPARAIALLTQAAEAGVASAQFELALCYQEGEGVPQDMARCVHWYQLAAAQGHGAAINNLADKYEHGTGVAQDIDKAVALYRQAVEHKIHAAWYSLANLHAEGRGVPRDLKEAVRLMALAASHDFLDAKRRLTALRRALHPEQMAQARQALAEAASRTPQALYELADALQDPSVPESLPLAFGLYLAAAERGLPRAVYRVARLYEEGRGTPVDLEQALQWMEKAAGHKIADAAERLDALRDFLAAPSPLRKPWWKRW